MLATERLLEIEFEFGSSTQRIICLELDDESIRLVLFMKDGTNLRVAEQWNGAVLKRYSYYLCIPMNPPFYIQTYLVPIIHL